MSEIELKDSLDAVSWISIANGRLPEKFQECIVLDKNKCVHNWIHDDALLPLFAQYTHWMPLPEPPEVKEGENGPIRSATMISEIGNELVAAYGEACKAFAWFGPLSMRDMVRAENALVGFIAALEAANAGLTAELSALRAEKAELDSGMHEMRAYRDGYDPKTKPPTETGEYLCLLRIGDPEIGDRFAVIDWDGTRFRCLDCTVLRYWPLPAGKGGE